MTLDSLNRWKAAGIHLCLSALIAATVVVVMLAVWYPRPYFDAMSGQTLLALIVGVDVTLGPFLTLLVFELKNKTLKALKFDLAVIATCQVAALAYGVWVTYEARPVYTAFVKDRFDVVAANEIDPNDLAAGPSEYRTLSLTGPRLIGVRLPTDPKELSDLIFKGLAGKDAQDFPKYYVPYADVTAEVIGHAKPMATLIEKYPDAQAPAEALAARLGRSQNDLGIVPLHGRDRFMTAVIDMRNGAIAGFLPFDPS